MAGGSTTETGSLYSPTVGLIYIFNLIVGTGALTMPKAFLNAGWLLSLVVVVVLAFMSYLTVTFVVETMAAANAMVRWKKLKKMERSSSVNVDDISISSQGAEENKPLMQGLLEKEQKDYFDITERIEMGKMASMFFHKVGKNIFYIVIAIYLYGDLAIYAAAVPKSMRDVACNFRPANMCALNTSLTDDLQCWSSSSLSRDNAYRIFVMAFILLLGPFVFFNVQKTKGLQIFTTIMRWAAFLMMIVLAIIQLARGRAQGHPAVVDFKGVPSLFGICVYAFMCHHSLPSLVTPIKEKSKLSMLFAMDYTLIMSFYALLSFTGIFAFGPNNFQDLYTLNFAPQDCDTAEAVTNVKFIQYFLALFPVFTLSTNFPIIGITLRNNLKTLFDKDGRGYPWMIDNVVFPLVTLVPPAAVAFATNDLELLVGITGSYAGAAIQYIVPAALVYYSRKTTSMLLGSQAQNKHISPFKHVAWIIVVLVWAGACIVFVTVNHIITKK